MKSLFTSKTFLLAVLQAVAGIVATVMATDPNLATVGWVVIVKSVVDVLLRLVTSEKVYVA